MARTYPKGLAAARRSNTQHRLLPATSQWTCTTRKITEHHETHPCACPKQRKQVVGERMRAKQSRGNTRSLRTYTQGTPPPLVQALPCRSVGGDLLLNIPLFYGQALPCPSTYARLAVVSLDVFDHGFMVSNMTLRGCALIVGGKGELDHASRSSSCSYRHSTCNCNPATLQPSAVCFDVIFSHG